MPDGPTNTIDALTRAGQAGLRLSAARYAYHRLVCQRYAEAVRGGFMGIDEAMEHYGKAMRNYDGIVANAPFGHTEKGNQESMDKGPAVILEMLESMRG